MDVVVAVWLARIVSADRTSRRIPNTLVVPAVSAVLVCACVHPQIGVAALAATAPYLCAWSVRGCGGGDVKLAFVLGGITGHWPGALGMVALAAIADLATRIVVRGPARAPHGPAMVAASLVVWACG